jgi:septum formation protein
MTQLILGSQSPRRKEILSFFSLPFKTATSDFDEESVPFHGNPAHYACEIAIEKARLLATKFPEDLILTADTVVYHDGKIYGKPKTPEEGFLALKELAGKWHSVFTGLALSKGDQLWSVSEETRVLFNPMTDDEIRHYHKKLHCADKAGSYAIQNAGGLAVKRIEGCYYNVMGLPINSVRQLLLNVQIDLWDYLQ